LELFKKLPSVDSQNKVLDAMEDWQDERAELDMIKQADDEERRIKQMKLDAIKASNEVRELKEAEEKKQGAVVHPGEEEKLKQEKIEAEIKRLKAQESAKKPDNNDGDLRGKQSKLQFSFSFFFTYFFNSFSQSSLG
jgi:hypothetical protein